MTLTVVEPRPWCRIVSLGRSDRGRIPIRGPLLSLVAQANRTPSRLVFVYRSSGSNDWSECRAWTAHALRTRTARSFSEPDSHAVLTASFLWDISALPDGDYQVRAVDADAPEPDDAARASEILPIRIGGPVALIEESADARSFMRRQIFSFAAADTAELADGTMLVVPASALVAGESVAIRIIVFAAASLDAPPPSGVPLAEPGRPLYRRFLREDGRSLFADTIEIAIPYDRSALTVPEGSLAIHHYDPLARRWIREPSSRVDTPMQLVRARLNHFTDFAVFGAQAAGSLSNVIVYPNPFVPYDNDDANGRPYVAGDMATGIIFANVTAGVDISIYTIAGRLAATIHASNTGGNIQWDARGDDRRELASGVYIAVIRSRSGETATRKIMIVR